jgi:hypothetical protein
VLLPLDRADPIAPSIKIERMQKIKIPAIVARTYLKN